MGKVFVQKKLLLFFQLKALETFFCVAILQEQFKCIFGITQTILSAHTAARVSARKQKTIVINFPFSMGASFRHIWRLIIKSLFVGST